MKGFWLFLRIAGAALLAGFVLAGVASVTGIISYTHIEALTLVLHGSRRVARLMPFAVDGTVVIGGIVLLQAIPGHERLGWLGVVPGVGVSVLANFAAGIPWGWKSAAWFAVPAVFFGISTYMFERWAKYQVTRIVQALAEARQSARAEAPSDRPGTSEIHGEPPEPPTPEAALRVLLATGSRRALGEMLGVPKSRVDAWHARYSQHGDGGPDVAEGSAEDESGMAGSLNGSGPGNLRLTV